MFGISGEHVVILAIVLIVFGPKRLPELGNTLGKALRNFKDSMAGVEEAKFRHLEEEHKIAPPPVISTADPHAPKPDDKSGSNDDSGSSDKKS